MKISSSVLPLNVLLWLIAASVLFLFAYSSSVQTIVAAWSGVEVGSSNHGWLVLGCTLYLLWLKKDMLVSLPIRPSALAFVLLVGAAALWFLCRVTQIQAGQMAMMPMLILLAVGAFCSLRHMFAVLLPVGLLFFALPIWQPLLPVLQDITTAVTHFNLRLIGRPVYVVDNFVHVSGGSFVIEEACSGLRFLLVSTTLSLMNSAMNNHTLKQGTLMLSLAIALSFIANWVRVLVVILLGDFTQMQHPWVNDHANMGWALYLVLVLVPFFVVSRYLPFTPDASAATMSGYFSHNTPAPRSRLVQVLAALALLLTPFVFQWLGSVSSENAVRPALPPRIAEWSAAPDVNAGWKPAFLNSTSTLTQAYRRGQQVVRINLSWYQSQEQGAELINVNNAIVDEQTWHIEPASQSIVELPEGVSVQAVTVRGAKQERVWYWYDVGGYVTSNDYAAKINQVRAFMSGRGDATLVAISAPCSGTCESQDALLREFFSVMPLQFQQTPPDVTHR